MGKTKFKEIFKLKTMLEKENIPFDFIDRSHSSPEVANIFPDGMYELYQICYPCFGEGRWISVIEGFGTYGGQYDKLEIMGGLTPFEQYEYGDSAMGNLTAHNVFNRIKKHYLKDLIEKGII